MSTTATPSRTATATTTDRKPVFKHGLIASIAASAATTALAAAAMAAGVTFADPAGVAIPLLGFTQLTLIFSLIGVGIAAVLARRARRPRSTFLRTTVTLTVLSCVPDVVFGFDAASAVTLIALHIVAALIVVPVLTRRLAATR